MVRIGVLAIVETAADKAKGVYRRVDGYEIEGGKRVALDQKYRLFTVSEKGFYKPPDWHVHLWREPALWFPRAMMLMQHVLRNEIAEVLRTRGNP
jgi:hypothetical protein